MAGEQKVDWIVVGSGASGLSSALFAARHGWNVLVIEKAPVVGGATAYSYGSLWFPNNPLERAAGLEDSEQDALAYLEYLSGGFAVEERLLTFAREAPVTVTELMQYGVELQMIEGVSDHYYPMAPGSRKKGRMLEVTPLSKKSLPPSAPPLQDTPYMPQGISWTQAIKMGGLGHRFAWDPDTVREAASFCAAGQGLVAALLLGCLRSNVRVLTEAKAARLLVDDGRVLGLEFEQGGSRRAADASFGIFLGTGGYENNPELVKAFQWFPNTVSHYPPTQTGDGLVMAMEVGAAIRVMPLSLSSMVGYWIAQGDGPPRFHSCGIQELAYPHSVVVNTEGKRFADESFFQQFTVALRTFDVFKKHRYKNLPCFLLFDQEFATRYPFAGNRPGQPIPQWVKRADSWAELAKLLNVDRQGLEQMAATFNASARLGRDPQFGRGETSWAHSVGDPKHPINPNVAPLERPPFYGIDLLPSESSAAGLHTDRWGRVTSVRDRPIDGLYAGGVVTARTEYGAGYQAGFSLAGGITFARLAVQHAQSVVNNKGGGKA